MSFILGQRRRAIALAMIFGTTWMRLMGLKSEIDSAPSFLGRRTTLAVLMMWKFDVDSLEKALIAVIRSTFIMSQQERKKAMEKPLGPGALSAGMSSRASLISSSEKGRPRSSRG
jgi:hypothetical protein